jgi:hypothetical protein
MFWTHGSFLLKYIKSSQKLKWFNEHLIIEKKIWNKKTTCPHVFFESFKHTKWLLKHCEFSWKFCSCNFESIKNYLKNYTTFLIYIIPMVNFQKFDKQFLRIVHILCGSLIISCFHLDGWRQCRNLNLGLAIKARACEGAGQEWSLGDIFHAPESVGVCESVREWTSTLPS